MNRPAIAATSVATLLLAGCLSARSAFDVNDVRGEWNGFVSQPGSSNYPMELVISRLSPGPASGAANYPTFPCTASLTYHGQVGERHIFSEVISAGSRSDCMNTTIAIRPAGSGELIVEWYVGSAEGEAAATATLRR